MQIMERTKLQIGVMVCFCIDRNRHKGRKKIDFQNIKGILQCE